MISLSRLKRQWLRFTSDETASVSVEFVMMAPLMAWAFVSTLQYFDAYRAELISTKAAVTIADIYSRQDTNVTPDFLEGTQKLLKFLTLAENSPDYRVTVFYYQDSDKKYYVAWSRNRGSRTNMKDPDIQAETHRLPKLADGERAILVETWTDYTPKYSKSPGLLFMGDANLKPLEFNTFLVTSPRFSPSVCFENPNNGKTWC